MRFFFISYLIIVPLLLPAQGIVEEFNNETVPDGWQQNDAHQLSVENGELKIAVDKEWWDGFHFRFDQIDISENPYVSAEIRTDSDLAFRIWLWDADDKYLESFVDFFIPASDTMTHFFFNFTDRYNQADPSKLVGLLFNFNPGGVYTGNIWMDNFRVGNSAINKYPETIIPAYLDTAWIEIEQDSIDELETHPLTSEDVHGNFYDNWHVLYENIQLHYRGASNLRNMIEDGKMQRNWKVKVDKDQLYYGRREWNFNFESHLRQEMAYHLFKKAGVKCVPTRHVNLMVNGARHGLYLEYADPDDKRWINDVFGDDSGDIYKAAFDISPYPRAMAELIYLGPTSEDYFIHYNKKTNHKGDGATDYTSIRDFIIMLNYTPNDQFKDTIKRYFDVDGFIKYLIVSNFIGNWDGYPHRPKNFWMYHNPSEDKWTFIPWDLDATFQIMTHWWNQMGPYADIYYQFYETLPHGGEEYEDDSRPLVNRTMRIAEFHNAYINGYKDAVNTFLSRDSIFYDLDSLASLIRANSGNGEWQEVQGSVAEIKAFVHDRLTSVNQQLQAAGLLSEDMPMDSVPPYPDLTVFNEQAGPDPSAIISFYPNPFNDKAYLEIALDEPETLRIDLLDITGRVARTFGEFNFAPGTRTIVIDGSDMDAGIYILRIAGQTISHSRRILITD